MNDEAAFPVAVPADWDSVQNGMSLRDYFAGQAMVGMLSGREPDTEFAYRSLAAISYCYAEAMMQERD
jgi:hypothetical protein